MIGLHLSESQAEDRKFDDGPTAAKWCKLQAGRQPAGQGRRLHTGKENALASETHADESQRESGWADCRSGNSGDVPGVAGNQIVRLAAYPNRKPRTC